MRLAAAALALLVGLGIGRAGAQEAGDFDYYLLALSWSPSWCAAEGDARGAEECAAGAGLGFTLHGLWPQYEAGWPEWCATAARDPSRRETAAMADLMGSGGLAWYQWQKHGRCSGLDPAAYFGAARQAVGALALPEAAAGRVTAAALEAGFLALNPEIGPEGLIVTCREGMVMEVRICLDQSLDPRECGEDVLERACRGDRPLALPAPR